MQWDAPHGSPGDDDADGRVDVPRGRQLQQLGDGARPPGGGGLRAAGGTAAGGWWEWAGREGWAIEGNGDGVAVA
jgi:hypothetical protein